MMFRKAQFVSIDIETKNLSDSQIEFESQFLKSHPGTKDEDKKQAQVAAKKESLAKKGALTNSAEIACIGFWNDYEQSPFVLHTFDFNKQLDGIATARYESEASMLYAFAQLMNDSTDEQTEVVVANAGFDLPKLRYAAAIRSRTTIPEIIKPRSPNPIYDVLYMAGKYYMVGTGQEFTLSLEDLAKHLGLSSNKVIHGSKIPDLIDQGEYETIITYNAIDALLTGRAYQILTGRY